MTTVDRPASPILPLDTVEVVSPVDELDAPDEPATDDLAPPDAVDAPADSTELTIVESVGTALTGVALGGAAIWFLAPICFNC